MPVAKSNLVKVSESMQSATMQMNRRNNHATVVTPAMIRTIAVEFRGGAFTA